MSGEVKMRQNFLNELQLSEAAEKLPNEIIVWITFQKKEDKEEIIARLNKEYQTETRMIVEKYIGGLKK
jgi:hypothetical protein